MFVSLVKTFVATAEEIKQMGEAGHYKDPCHDFNDDTN